MSIATLVVAAAGAAFTAAAAAAAWRAVVISARDARARTEPFVGVSLPRCDYDINALIVPLKNLGLGPARMIAIQVKREDGGVCGVRVAPGLAPMESEGWPIYIVDGGPMPDPSTVTIEGTVENASGAKLPLHLFGSMELPHPDGRGWPDEPDAADEPPEPQ